MTYEFQFASSMEDLLEAEKAEWNSRTVHAPFRSLFAVFGAAWIIVGIMALGPGKQFVWPLISIALGFLLVYFFALKTFIRRAQIKKLGAGSQKVALFFGDDSLKIQANGHEFIRQWADFRDFVNARKGVLFYFADGTANWLPDRVFADKDERTEFLDFVESHMPEKKR